MQRLGVTQLREEQEKCLNFILKGRDALIRLRTGGGKSLLYQLPALLDAPSELTLVFSPLLALQHDQVDALHKKGIRAALLNSELCKGCHAETLHSFAQNGGLLYLAPEQLRREDVRTALSSARVRRDDEHDQRHENEVENDRPLTKEEGFPYPRQVCLPVEYGISNIIHDINLL